ncbi:MAG TPA: helix-turn-helix transcriptional regulator, partial [Polyangiales bacterium]|nr:helix-turn-helix transcriptional regulator [Polyangiales bacterium]
LHRKLGFDSLRGALLDTLLERMEQAAFLLRVDGVIELANRAGEELLGHTRGREELRTLREEARASTPSKAYELTPIAVPGLPPMTLAIRMGKERATALALALASRAWSLSSKAALVLERVCEGDSNKEIAQALQCAEVTVERHITLLFRASGARSRSDLVARVHRV